MEKREIYKFVEMLVKHESSEERAEFLAVTAADLAAKHLALCAIDLEGEGLSEEQASAREAIELNLHQLLASESSVANVTFQYDPRGTTVTVNMRSGESNSLAGGWKVPVSKRALAALSDTAFWEPYASTSVAKPPRGLVR